MHEEIKKYIVDICLLGEGDVGYDQPLIGSGILDSLNFLNLLGFVQKTYGVFVDMNEVDPEEVNTINNIVTFIKNKKRKSDS